MKPHVILVNAVKLGAAVMLAQGSVANAAEIKLLSSTALKTVLEVLVPEFERASGHKLSIAYDTAATLMGRIKGGETTDVAILTGPGIDELIKQGKVAAGGRADLARSGIGVAVRTGAPKPDIGSVEAFRRALLNAKSVAYAGTGASGMYFAGLTGRLGIADQVKAKAKIVPGGYAGELVAKGEAEIAVQQIPELMAVPGIEVVGPLPPEVQNVTVFSAGVFTGAMESEAARALVRFLSTPAAGRVIKAKGMEPG